MKCPPSHFFPTSVWVERIKNTPLYIYTKFITHMCSCLIILKFRQVSRVFLVAVLENMSQPILIWQKVFWVRRRDFLFWPFFTATFLLIIYFDFNHTKGRVINRFLRLLHKGEEKVCVMPKKLQKKHVNTKIKGEWDR